jgi:hypothetical protein
MVLMKGGYRFNHEEGDRLILGCSKSLYVIGCGVNDVLIGISQSMLTASRTSTCFEKSSYVFPRNYVLTNTTLHSLVLAAMSICRRQYPPRGSWNAMT